MTLFKRNFLFLIACLFSVHLFAQPVINSFSPASGPVGTSVTITGNNFNTVPANNIVYFGAVKANVISASGTSIIATVPAGSTYQPITVTVNGLTGSSSRPFGITFTGGGNINSTSFDVPAAFTTDLHPNDIAITDLDGDGKPDIATANNYSSTGQPASVSILKNTSVNDTITFANKQDLTIGAVCYAIAAGDIDGDGKPDIIASSLSDQIISIFKNTSSTGVISFAQKLDIPSGGSTVSIVTGDIDGDGKPDIAIVNSTENVVSLFRNTSTIGSISFAPRLDLITGLYPKDLVMVDLDGDGKTDIAVTNKLSNSYSVFKNISSPGNFLFSANTDISCGAGMEPFGITAVDLDNDNKLDLVVVVLNKTAGTSAAQVYRNSSSIVNLAFSRSITLAGSGSESFYTSAGDINGDGKPDLAFSLTNQDAIKVFQNSSLPGTFSFSQSPSFSSPFGPFAVSLADLNADGKPDMITAHFTGEKISIFKNRSGEPFVSSFTPTTAAANVTVTITGSNFLGVTAVTFGGIPAASFNIVNSSTITAITGSGASGDVVVRSSLGAGSKQGFTFAAPPIITSFTPTNAGIGDTVTIVGSNILKTTAVSFGGIPATSFNVVNATTVTAVVGEGATGNIILTNSFGADTLTGFIFQPPPAITSFTPASGGTGTILTITGINFNNVLAVTVGGVNAESFVVNSPTSISAHVGEGATGSIGVITAWGASSSAGIFNFPPPGITSFTPSSGAVGSSVTISGTNFKTDISGIQVYFGAVKATITAATVNSLVVTVPVGATYSPISVTLNNQIVKSDKPFNTVYPEENPSISSSSFRLEKSFRSAQEDPRTIAIADLDGDGKSDIITGNVSTSTISVFRNISGNSVIAFAPSITLSGGFGGALYLATEDINCDGKLDIIVSSFQSRIAIFLNTSIPGSITFNPDVEIPTLDVSRGVAVADFDGDAKPDIAVTTSSIYTNGSFISIFKNTGYNGTVAFAPRLDIPIAGIPYEIYAVDIDQDGRKDLAIGFSNAIGTLQNTGTGNTISFGPVSILSSGYFTTHLSIVDIDADGKPDIVSARYYTNNVEILRNTSVQGNPSFATGLLIDAGNELSGDGPFRVTAGQLNGDGKPDLVVLNQNKKGYLYQNTSIPGSVSFNAGLKFIPQYVSNWFDDVVIGDLDGDAKDDYVVADGPDDKITAFRNRSGFPNISSFTPVRAHAGDTVIINGSGFTGTNSMKFGDIEASSFSVINSTTISAVVGPGASGIVKVTSPIGYDTLSGFSLLAPPVIKSLAPASGPSGAVIKITGTYFTGVTAVSFGGTVASSFSMVNDTTISAVVGAGASGAVTVTTPEGTASIEGFTFFAAPAITSFSPDSGGAGSTITITGTNFESTTAVSFGGVTATSFTVVNNSTINAIVAGGATGNVIVTSTGGQSTKAGFTFIALPTIISFTPSEGATGTVITITGKNLSGATSVTVGAVPVISFTVINSTTITAVVAAGASGDIAVVTPGGIATAAGYIFIETNGDGLFVSPNPAHNTMYVQYPLLQEPSKLELINTQGKIIKSILLSSNTSFTEIDIRGMLRGVYILAWRGGNKKLSRSIMIY